MGFDEDSELKWVTKNGKQGYLDKDGNEIVPCIYDVISSFSEGVTFAKRDGVVVIEKDGKYGWPKDYIKKAEKFGI